VAGLAVAFGSTPWALAQDTQMVAEQFANRLSKPIRLEHER
jgi:hypothetical protein